MADIVFPGQDAGPALNSGALPKNADLVIYKGDFVRVPLSIVDALGAPVVITNGIPKAMLKTDYNDRSPKLFECTITNGPQGKAEAFLSSEVTSQLLPGSYIWDFQITDENGETRTYFAGDITVYNEVTT